MNDFITSIPLWVWIILLVWDVAWRGTALWKSARKGQMAWFVCLIIFNTIGILPIIYLLINRKRPLSASGS